MEKSLLRLGLLWLLIELINAAPPPPVSTTERPYPFYNETRETNQTIEQLVQKQTDTIKKIVTDQQTRPSYPKYATETQQKKQDLDKLSMEELKIKCQQLARLIGANASEQEIAETNFKPVTRIKVATKRPVSGFYITTDAAATTMTTRKPSTTETPKPTPIPIKYIKLEPVILQKTIMSDGRTIYYWHKNLPGTVQISPQSPPSPQIPTTPTTTSTTSTTTTTTTTTTPPPPPSSGYDFRNFFPSFYSFGSVESSSETTTEKTTTPTTITTTASTEQPDELLYTQQLRFVVPVPYASADSPGIKHPWDFDQFAYYPKQLQPETVNVRVPYVPTFHVIKALAVPNKYPDDSKNDDYNTGIDSVNI